MSSQNTTLECRACDPKVIQIARNVTEHFDGLIVRSHRGKRHIYRPFDIEVRSDRVRVSDYKGNRATIRYKDTGMSPADVIAKLHECKCGGGDGISAGYEVVSELPEFIAPGVQVLYNGTMWRGLVEGESSLPAGTPWPVKGYKELSFNASFSSNNKVISIVKSDFVLEFAEDTTIQVHEIEIIDESLDATFLVNSSNVFYLNNSDTGVPAFARSEFSLGSRLVQTRLEDADGVIINGSGLYSTCFVKYELYPPPPTP